MPTVELPDGMAVEELPRLQAATPRATRHAAATVEARNAILAVDEGMDPIGLIDHFLGRSDSAPGCSGADIDTSRSETGVG